MIAEHAQIDHDRWRIGIAAHRINTRFKIDRRKENAPSLHRVIPETSDENVAARSPDIMGGRPIPIRPSLHPIARTPGVTALIPNPGTWRPSVVQGRWGDIRTHFHRCGRCRQIGCLPHRGVSPIPRGPLKPLRSSPPVAGHPFATRRQGAPRPTDPKEVPPFVVPGPVAGNPGDVVSLRFFLGRHFFNDGGRTFCHHDSGLGIEGDDSGERLVNRAAREHLRPGRIDLGRLSMAGGYVHPDPGDNHQRCGQAVVESVESGTSRFGDLGGGGIFHKMGINRSFTSLLVSGRQLR